MTPVAACERATGQSGTTGPESPKADVSESRDAGRDTRIEVSDLPDRTGTVFAARVPDDAHGCERMPPKRG